jgi:hypothetical protein
MFLRDLEPYRYGVPEPLKDVLAVGWLSKISDYTQGVAPPGFVDVLAKLLSTHRVNQTRGYHVCEFCSKSPLTCHSPAGRKITLGSAELWIPSVADSGPIYASPDLIHHYVTEHHYRPPNDFIDAVMSARDTPDWDAHSECERRLEAAYRAREC